MHADILAASVPPLLEIDDATVLRAQLARTSAGVGIRTADGGVRPVGRTLVVGRNPDASGYDGADVLAVPDGSVSKTHLVLTRERDWVIVTDLHSTNGTAVISSTGVTTCLPDQPVRVGVGSTIRAGHVDLEVVGLG